MSRRPDFALALLRLGVGCLFLGHGYHKLFGVGLETVTAQFAAWGLPMPLLFAPLVSALEMVGGGLLLLGLGTVPLAGLLAVDMAAALILNLGGPAALSLDKTLLTRLILAQSEVPALLLLACLTLLVGGAGWPSVDAAWSAGGSVRKPAPLAEEPPPPPRKKRRSV